MATQETKIVVTVDDKGTTEKLNQQAQKTHKSFKDLIKTAAGVVVGGASKALAMSAPSAPTGSSKVMSEAQYGTASGILSGGGARSFAEESKGLGGLVRTYATFAANLFAATSAFNALKEAAQTDSLVKGLDAIGAASGKDLGTLSKRLVEATDGAISLREAMSATAQASAAGMSSKNIERLAVVAKNASALLGVSMTDAVNRLSRGITKLEPELLDELGLFTKIGPATEKYALEVGKAVSQLTDFERRQAFANAVLDEGEQKYNALSDASSNAYDKLLATAKNTTQQILSVINTVLEPLAGFLANNPLTVALGTLAIAGALVKRAMPDMLGSLAKLQEANAKVTEEQEAFLDSSKRKQAALLAERDAAQKSIAASNAIIEAKINEADAAEMAIAKLSESKARAQKLGQIFGGTDKLDEILGKQGNYTEATKQQLQALRDEAAKHIGTNKKAAEGYTALADAIEHMQAAISKESASKETLASATDKLQKSQAELKKVEEDATKAKNALAMSSAKLSAANTLQEKGILGLSAALKVQNDELRQQGATSSQVFAESGKLIGGYFLGQISKALSALTYLTAAWSAISLVLDIGAALFSKNAKEMETFSKSATTSSSSAENLTRTVEALDKRTGAGSFGISGIAALSTALAEATQAAESTVEAAKKAEKSLSLSWWDSLGNSIMSVFGKDIASKEAKALGEQIEGIAAVLRRTATGAESLDRIREALGGAALDAESATEAFKGLDDISKAKLIKTLKDLSAGLDTTAQALNSFKSSLDSTYKAYQEFIQSTASSNPLLKLGSSLQALGGEMAGIFVKGDTSSMLSAMNELSSDTNKAALFGDKFVGTMVNLKAPLSAALEETSNLRKEHANITAEIEKQTKKFIDMQASMGRGGQEMQAYEEQRLDQQQQVLEGLYGRLREQNRFIGASNEKTQSVFAQATSAFASGMLNAFKEGAKFVAQALGEAQTKAALDLAKAQAGGLSGEARAIANASIAQKEFAIQERLINSNLGIINSQAKLAAIIEASTAEAALSRAEKEGTPESKQTAKAILDAANAFKAFTNQPNRDTSLAGIERFAASQNLSQLASAQFKTRALALSSQVAGQEAARTEVRGKAAAAAETGRQERISGRLEDETKLSQLVQQTQSIRLQTLNTLNAIAGVSSRQVILEQSSLEQEILLNRQRQEQEALAAEFEKAGNNQAQLSKLKAQQEELTTKQIAEQAVLRTQTVQKTLASEIDAINKRYELLRSNGELEKTIALSSLDYQTQELSLLGSRTDISKEYLVNKQAELDQAKLLVETSASMQQIQDTLTQKREEYDAKIAAAGGAQTVQGQALTAEFSRQESIANNTIAALSTQFNQKSGILEKTREINAEQERHNELIAQSASLAGTLKTVFGDLGSAIGSSVQSMVKFAITTERNAAAQLKLEEDLAKAKKSNDPKKIAKAREDLDKQTRKGLIAEIDGISEIAGESKKMFAEKTAGFKVLAAVEKATAAASFALKAQDMATTLALLPGKIAGGVAQLFNQGGWAGFAGAAAFLALMGSLGFAGGGKGAFIPSSEQRQETQGTAMGYNAQGEKVQVRRGVFGDTEAKSESIAKSLEVIKETSVDGLSNDNKVVSLLSSINEGIRGAARGLYRVEGLRTGSLFGTKEGSSGGGIFTGSLGGSSSTSINDAGLIIKGTFAQLASDTNEAAIDLFEEVTKTKKSWYGKKKTSVETLTKEIDAPISEFFSDIFGNARDLFIEVGKEASIGEAAVNSILEALTFDETKYSLRGLKGEELEKEVSSIIGSMLDDAALAIFGSFEQFAQFGEGMLETVIRVTDTNKKITKALLNTGSVSADLLQGNYTLTENFIKGFEDLNDFLDQSSFFAENFLTEAERLAPVQKQVTEELNALGLAGIETKGQFAAVVRSLDLTTETGQTTYTALLKLAPAFAKVAEAAEETFDSIDSLYDITGKLGILNQDYLDVLEKQQSSLSSSVDKLKSFIKTINDFRASLLLSNLSTLTPQQRYEEAKAQYEAVLSKAKTGDEDAMSKLQGAAQAFLTESQTFYASSAGYQQDFSAVQQALSNSVTSAGALLTESEKQLAGINTQLELLNGTKKSVETIEQYILAIATVLTDGFALLDTNLDGILTYEELKASGIASDAEIQNMMKLLDLNNDGQITYLEAISQSTKAGAYSSELLTTLIPKLLSGQISGGEFSSSVSGLLPTDTGIVTASGQGLYISSGGATAVDNMLYGKKSGQAITVDAARAYLQALGAEGNLRGVYDAAIDWGVSSAGLDKILGIEAGSSLAYAKQQGWPAFAVGTNFVPEDMPAIVHKGERIIPAADNAELLNTLNSRRDADAALLNEVRILNQKVASLEATVRDGAVINAKATDRNTQEVTKAVKDSSSQSNYLGTIKGRATLV